MRAPPLLATLAKAFDFNGFFTLQGSRVAESLFTLGSKTQRQNEKVCVSYRRFENGVATHPATPALPLTAALWTGWRDA
jgi:hypothetical protein